MNSEALIGPIPTKQLAQILGISITAVLNLANSGIIRAEVVNGRGDKRFDHMSLIGSLPEPHRKNFMAWFRKKMESSLGPTDQNGKPVRDENLPAETPSSETNRNPARITDIISIPEAPSDKDPWFSLPKSQRDTAFDRMRLVNAARDIVSNTKRGKKQTRVLKSFAAQNKIGKSTLDRYRKMADDALSKALESGADTVMAQLRALTPAYGKNKSKFRSWDNEALAFAGALYLGQQRLNLTDVYRDTVNAAEIHGWRVGSYDSLRSAFSRIDGATKTLSRKSNHSFEADHSVKILRDYGILYRFDQIKLTQEFCVYGFSPFGFSQTKPLISQINIGVITIAVTPIIPNVVCGNTMIPEQIQCNGLW